jgi:glucokinase
MSPAEAPLYASIDLGGTKIACALATADGRVRAARTVATPAYDGPEAVLGEIASVMLALATEAGQAPAAAGLGVPGLVDVASGVTRFLPNLPTQWRGVPAGATLTARLGYPVHVLNDARMATLGELVFGHGRNVSTMALFTLGTGIGGGIVIDGRLRLGALGAAGELGAQTIIPDGPLCSCGNRGCLETLASGPAIAAQGVWLLQSGRAPRLREIVGGDAGKVTPRELAAAAAAGDTDVREVLVRAAGYLGIGVANVVTILHPELVVLAGGVADLGPLLFDTVREVVRQRVRLFPPDDVRIERSELGAESALWGGIALAMQRGIDLRSRT